MQKFKTKILIFKNLVSIKAAINYLMDNAQWFEVMPLPNGCWELSVKKKLENCYAFEV